MTTFALTGAHMLVVQAPGARALFLFVTPPETGVPSASAPDTLYFGPGIHDVGVIRPLSGQTIYLAAGALVRGRIEGREVTDVTIAGRGILDASGSTSRAGQTLAILFTRSSDLRIEGIGVRNAQWWQTLYVDCHDVQVDWTNLMAERINNDGIDIDGVQNASFANNFIDSGDDGFGWHAADATKYGQIDTAHVHALHTTFWNVTAGNPVRIGSSMEARTWTDISLSQSYVIRAHDSAFTIDDQDWATLSDVRITDFFVETRPVARYLIVIRIVKGRYSNTTGLPASLGYGNGRGHIDGVSFVGFHSAAEGRIQVFGADSTHLVKGVSFRDVRSGTTRIVRTAQVTHNAFVGPLAFS